MSRTAAEILEEARQLPQADLDWLIENLSALEGGGMDDAAFAEWQKQAGTPEPGYDEWFRAGVQEALADTSPDTPHEEAMKEFQEAIRKARGLKATA